MKVEIVHLQLDKKTGIYSYRRRLPKELVPFIPSDNRAGRGRIELKVSLRSKDPNTAAAKELYADAQRQYDAIVTRALRRQTQSFDPLDDHRIRYLADTYIHDHLKIDEAGRWKRSVSSVPFETRGHPEEVYLECREMLEAYDGAGLVAYWKDWAQGFAEACGFIIDPEGLGFDALCCALGEAACEVWLAIDKRLDGYGERTPAAPLPSMVPKEPANATSPASEAIENELTLQAVAERLMASKAMPLGESTLVAWSTALRFFREVHGTPAPSAINRQMVTEWIELMAQRPSRVAKGEDKLPLPELAQLYENRDDVLRVRKQTVRDRLAALHTIWNKGQETGLIREKLASPFKARKALATTPEEDEGAEFTLEELQAIFSLPVFTKGERPDGGQGDACYWLPLLMLWTGVRPEEAAQLLVSDFYQDEEKGALMLRIVADGEHPAKGARRLKSSGRDFLLPSALINLGLADYVQHLRAKGEVALFPYLTVPNKKAGHLIPSISPWWSQYLRANEVHLKPQGRKKRRPYRDFRPAWATAARTARIPEEAMSYLMGHSNARAVTTRRYGGKHPHADWMAEMAWPKLDLSLVKPWQPPQ